MKKQKKPLKPFWRFLSLSMVVYVALPIFSIAQTIKLFHNGGPLWMLVIDCLIVLLSAITIIRKYERNEQFITNHHHINGDKQYFLATTIACLIMAKLIITTII